MNQKNIRIVPRSINAYEFISKYCKNVSKEYIDHGVNLNEFTADKNKKNQFIVLSQLIERKRIDGIIKIFTDYNKKIDNESVLNIIGKGDQEENLKLLVEKLNMKDKIIFKGFMYHKDMIDILEKSKAMIVNTIKDNSMISIVESLATCTPIITTDVPFNSHYIKKYNLGIVKKELSYLDIKEINEKNLDYINNCFKYRPKLSNEYKVQQFINEYNIISKNEVKHGQ